MRQRTGDNLSELHLLPRRIVIGRVPVTAGVMPVSSQSSANRCSTSSPTFPVEVAVAISSSHI